MPGPIERKEPWSQRAKEAAAETWSIEDEAKALRRGSMRGKRIWIGVFLGNVLVLASIVGGPYLRGRHRARAARVAFGAYVECLMGGSAPPEPGLALPEEALEHYVDQARSTAGWPGVCEPALRAIAPDDAFWVFPSVRYAEGEVRRAVSMVQGELREAVDSTEPALGETSGAAETSGATATNGAETNAALTLETIPERPWLATQRLMAAMTLWSEAADISLDVFEPAIRFERQASTVRPERIPLRASSRAELMLRVRADGIEALAFDERGLSWVRVGAGAADARRMRRPTLLRGGLFAPSPWLVWATPSERCGDERCARHSLGLAPLTDDDSLTPEPRYFAAHPAGPIERSVRISGQELTVAAQLEEGVQLRVFALDLPWPDEAGERSADAPGGSGNNPGIGSDGSDGGAAGGAEEGVDRASRANPSGPAAPTRQSPVRDLRDALLVGEPPVLVGRDAAGTVRDGEGRALSERTAIWLEGNEEVLFAGVEGGVERLALNVGARGGANEAQGGANEARGGANEARGGANAAQGGATEATGSDAEAQDTGSRAPPDSGVLAPPAVEVASLVSMPSQLSSRRVVGDARLSALAGLVGRTLHIVRCADTCVAESIEGVEHFDLAIAGDALFVAHSAGDAQIVVTRLGGPARESMVPAACFSESGGLCGRPTLSARGARLVVTSRDGNDLFAIESEGGRTWRRLRGLR